MPNWMNRRRPFAESIFKDDEQIFDENNNLMQKHYIYYKDLTTYHPNFGNYMYHARLDMSKAANERLEDSTYLREQAEYEQRKEEALLAEYFGTDIHFDLTTVEGIQKMIDTVNMKIGLEKIYRRNKAIIEAGMQKDSYSWISSKFGNILESPTYRDRITKAIKSKTNDKTAEITAILSDALELAVNNYLFGENDSGPNSLKNFEEYRDAYEELRDFMNFSNNEYKQRLFDIYGVSALVESLAKLTPKSMKSKFLDITKSVQGLQKNSTSGGNMLEEIINGVFQKQLLDKGAQGASMRGGQWGERTDVFFALGFDATPVFDQISETATKARTDARNKYHQIDKYLNNSSDTGFIVYTSAKNYTLNSDFRQRGGYSAGTAMTIAQYEELMQDVGGSTQKNFDTFIGLILNTAKNAIFEHDKEAVSRIIAQDVGAFLFDDWMIDAGNELTNENSVKSIHLMNLNGIFMPISTILSLMANAIDEVRGRATTSQFARATITTEPLLYYQDKPYWEEPYKNLYEKLGLTPHEAWEKQRQNSWDTTKIELHFMKTFREIMNSFVIS